LEDSNVVEEEAVDSIVVMLKITVEGISEEKILKVLRNRKKKKRISIEETK